MDLAALSDQAWQVGRLSVSARLRRLHSKAWLIGQCAVAAAVAWWIATHVFGHPAPFFAPSVAAVHLARDVVRPAAAPGRGGGVGCSIGIGIADVFARIFRVAAGGRSASSSPARCRNRGPARRGRDLGQPGGGPVDHRDHIATVGRGLSRIVDALIGGAVALVAATIVPGAPLRRPPRRPPP